MRPSSRIVHISLLLLLVVAACESPTGTIASGLYGRVYSNAGPGWFEHHYPCTIRVSTDAGKEAGEFVTDSVGVFRIVLPPGAYVLNVKESPDSAQSGPYKVQPLGYTEARAYYYNAMILAP